MVMICGGDITIAPRYHQWGRDRSETLLSSVVESLEWIYQLKSILVACVLYDPGNLALWRYETRATVIEFGQREGF